MTECFAKRIMPEGRCVELLSAEVFSGQKGDEVCETKDGESGSFFPKSGDSYLIFKKEQGRPPFSILVACL